MGPPPYDLDKDFVCVADHALVPTSREEVKRFIRVIEIDDNSMYLWRGEWLSLFPHYIELDEHDLAAWNAWIDRPEIDQFLDDTITECQRLAEISRHARGYPVLQGTREPDKNGLIPANLRIPTKGN